jgi:hypothetical protein
MRMNLFYQGGHNKIGLKFPFATFSGDILLSDDIIFGQGNEISISYFENYLYF